MANVLEIVSRIFPVILLIITGNLFRYFNFIKSQTVEDIKKLVVNITLPALLFSAFSNTVFELGYLAIFCAVFINCGIMLAVGRSIQKALKADNIYAPALFSGFETGMMGYSIFAVVYGADNLYRLAVVDLGQVTFVFFILIAFLKKADGAELKNKDIILSFLKSPVIVAIITGIIAGAVGYPVLAKGFPPIGAVNEALRLLSQLTMPLICLIIGYEIKVDLKNIFLPLKIAFIRTAILTSFAVLINTFIVRRLLGLDRLFEAAVYTMFILPPPFVIPIFAKKWPEKRQLLLNTISVSIVVSLIVYIILASLVPA